MFNSQLCHDAILWRGAELKGPTDILLCNMPMCYKHPLRHVCGRSDVLSADANNSYNIIIVIYSHCFGVSISLRSRWLILVSVLGVMLQANGEYISMKIWHTDFNHN